MLNKALSTLAVIILAGCPSVFSQNFIKKFRAVSSFAKMDNVLLFAADNDAIGVELWKTDGTKEGTKLVRDINPGTASAIVSNLFFFKGKVYFSATDGINGLELWVTDGTAAGTVMFKNINSGNYLDSGSMPDLFTVCNGSLYFRASEDGYFFSLWKTDGTIAGTVELIEGEYGGPSQFTAVGNTLYFTKSNTSLWKTDGSIAGTVEVPTDDYYTVDLLTNVNNELVYITNTSYRQNIRLYKLDPASQASALLQTFNAPAYGENDIANITQVGNGFYFSISTSPLEGQDNDVLWKSNGTSEGTQPVKSFNWQSHMSGSGMSSFFQINNKLYFSGTNGHTLFTTDGSEGGTIGISNVVLQKKPILSNGKLFFRGNRTLWSYDGTGTPKEEQSMPVNPDNLIDINGTVYFTVAEQFAANLWNNKADGQMQITANYQELVSGSTVNMETPKDSVSTVLVTVKNTGNAALALGDLSVVGSSFYLSGIPDQTVLPGQSTAFNLHYLPSKEEQVTGMLIVKNNDTYNGQVVVNLAGSASGAAKKPSAVEGLVKTISFTNSAAGFDLTKKSIEENAVLNTAVGSFKAGSGTDGYQYALIAGPGDTDNQSFKIEDGVLKSNRLFDFDTKNVYTVRIKASSTAANYEKIFSISVNNTQKNLAAEYCGPATEILNYTLDDVAYINSRIIAVGSEGKILISDNDGQDWRIVNSGVRDSFSKIKMTDDLTGYIIGYSGTILKTENGGDSWFPVESPDLTYPYVNNFYFYSSSIGFVFGEGKLFKTIDGGKNWKKMSHVFSSDRPYSAAFTDENNGFICGSGKLLTRTKDGGATWERVTIEDAGYNSAFNAITFVNNKIGYLMSSSGTVMKTTDGGNTWGKVGVYSDESVTRVYFNDEYNGYIVSGFNGSTLYKTTDGGISWDVELRSGSGLLGFAYNKISNKYCMVGHGTGLGYTAAQARTILLKDGSGPWTTRSILRDGDYYRVHFFDDKTGYVFGSDNFKTIDGGITWKGVDISSDSYNSIRKSFFINKNVGYYGDLYNIFKTVDGGANWLKCTPADYANGNTLYFIDDKVGFSANHSYIFKTTDGGNSWSKTTEGDGLAGIWSFQFIDAQNGFGVSFGKFYKTTDQGKTWTSSTLPGEPFMRVLYFFDNQTGLVGANDGRLFRTTDGGSSWTEIKTQIRIHFVSFVFTDKAHGYGLVNNNGGISELYESFDGGLTWKFVSQNSDVYDLSLVGKTVYLSGSRGLLTRIGGPPILPVNAGYIKGEAKMASSVKTSYAVPRVEGTYYNWTVTGSADIEYHNNLIFVTWKQGGSFQVKATPYNSCGNGEPRSLGVNVLEMPAPEITGPDNVESLSKGLSYSTPNRVGNTYAWTAAGGTISTAGNEAHANWGAPGAGKITVTETNAELNMKKSATLDVTIKKAFTLPADHFSVAVNAVSCKGSSNGMIRVKAKQKLSYKAILTAIGQPAQTHTFADSLNVTGLPDGTYSLCLSIEGNAAFERCFDLEVGAPKDLSVYSSVNERDQSLVLSMTGGAVYFVELNGKRYETSKSQFSLKLENGLNKVSVTTDKPCQGAFEKSISLNTITLYPNPVIDWLKIDLSSSSASKGNVEISDVGGRIVYNKAFLNSGSPLDIDMTRFSTGLYVLKLTLGEVSTVHKILKK